MRRLGGSLVSWLTFQQSARRWKMYKERWMYGAIYEVAAARNWTIWPEYHAKVGKKTCYVDFVFYGGTSRHHKKDRLAALEISYIKAGSKPQKISEDEDKLRAITVAKIDPKDVSTAKKFLMIVGKYSELKNYCSKYVIPAIPLFEDGNECSVGWIYHSSYPYTADTRWCVVILVVGTEKLSSVKPTAE
jgi:hypothetical protein